MPPILWLVFFAMSVFVSYKLFFKKHHDIEVPKYEPVTFGPAKYPVIPVPTDREARYQLLSKNYDSGDIKALIMREGPSGVSYAYKRFDCLGKYAYLGEGETADKALNGTPSNMAELTPESISSYQSLYLCTARTAGN